MSVVRTGTYRRGGRGALEAGPGERQEETRVAPRGARRAPTAPGRRYARVNPPQIEFVVGRSANCK